MGRLLALDIGKKRCGVAVTDPGQIIASPLTTVDAKELIAYLKQYITSEKVDCIIVGKPTDSYGRDTDSTRFVDHLFRQVSKIGVKTVYHDERYTSRMAMQSMISAGYSKKDRAKKENIDKVSAAIILQSYMEKQQFDS